MLTSYAQNFEDVILWRALGHVDRGFYIDIGAWDPVKDSISLAFYERGWRGLHIEPEPISAARLREARRDEDVLQVVVGPDDSSTSFYAIKETGLSTCDAAIADRHAGNGYRVERIAVPSMPLRDVLLRARERDVHWLKIDVEGMEYAVIRSWLPSSVRPWVVVVEVVRPYADFSDLKWEPSLLSLGYEFVYFDGLNCFYLSSAHPELRQHFGPGPNVFDRFALAGHASAPFCSKIQAEHLAAELAASERTRVVERRETALQAHKDDLRNSVAVLEGDNVAIARSLKWCRKELRGSRRSLWRVRTRCRALEAQQNELVAQLDSARFSAVTLDARVHALWAVADTHRRELEALQRSSSWRFTAPLRRSAQFAYACTSHSLRAWRRLAQIPRRLGALALENTIATARRSPRLKRRLMPVVSMVPGLRERATRFHLGQRPGSLEVARDAKLAKMAASVAIDCNAMAPSTRRIYLQISRARVVHSTP